MISTNLSYSVIQCFWSCLSFQSVNGTKHLGIKILGWPWIDANSNLIDKSVFWFVVQNWQKLPLFRINRIVNRKWRAAWPLFCRQTSMLLDFFCCQSTARVKIILEPDCGRTSLKNVSLHLKGQGWIALSQLQTSNQLAHNTCLQYVP